ncbi:MAG: hypothetical protein ACUVUC_08940 [Thermoguttaceae bacterium]
MRSKAWSGPLLMGMALAAAGALIPTAALRGQEPKLDIQIPLPEQAARLESGEPTEPSRGPSLFGRRQANALRENHRLRANRQLEDHSTAPNQEKPASPSPFPREHIVDNPHGQMTQTWDRIVTDEGFSLRREQTWISPDGLTVRQHDSALTGSDPLNYQRERTLTLQDGRTIEHSYSQSWDGTTLGRQRTFTGPNGQTHTWQQTITPGSEPDGPQWAPPLDAPGWQQPAGPETPGVPLGPIPGQPSEQKSGKATAWGKWNPFGKIFGASDDQRPANRPSGFTLGSGGRAPWGASAHGLAKRQAGQPESAPSVLRRLRIQGRERATAQRAAPRSGGRR